MYFFPVVKRRNEVRDVQFVNELRRDVQFANELRRDVQFVNELRREVVKLMDLAKRRSLPIVQAKQAAKEGRPHPARK